MGNSTMDNGQAALTYGQAVKILTAALATSKDATIQAAIAACNSGHTRRVGVNPVLAMLTAGGVGSTVHEDKLYAAHKVGRKDAYWIIADAIKLAADKNARQWVQFNADSGVYTYVGNGATPPAGYTGYVPKSERV